MKRSNRKRHRPEEVVTKLRQSDEALAKGTPIAEVARSLAVSEVTLHRWRAEYGAMDRDAVRRMKDLENTDRRAKQVEPPWPRCRGRGRGGSRHRGEGGSVVVCHGLARLEDGPTGRGPGASKRQDPSPAVRWVAVPAPATGVVTRYR